jgi:hypothetical protein
LGETLAQALLVKLGLRPGLLSVRDYAGHQLLLLDDVAPEVRLVSSLEHESAIPSTGNNLIIVAAVGHVLHFKMFDPHGEVALSESERGLWQKADAIQGLRQRIAPLFPPHQLTESESAGIVSDLASILGHIRKIDRFFYSAVIANRVMMKERKNISENEPHSLTVDKLRCIIEGAGATLQSAIAGGDKRAMHGDRP